MSPKPSQKAPPHRPERLQKIMATAGLGSRRALDKRIAAGEVKLNGETIGPGCTASAGDVIGMDHTNWKVVTSSPAHRWNWRTR
jgi:23S rRNA pseudouridine2605 synthase